MNTSRIMTHHSLSPASQHTVEKQPTGPRAYETHDFWLACFLKANGFRLVDTQRDGQRTTFVFQDRPDRQECVLAFFNDGMVAVNALTHAVRDLKSIIHASE